MQKNLEAYLQEKREYINQAIEEFLPAEEGSMPAVEQAMRYSLLAGGKRLRPICY